MIIFFPITHLKIWNTRIQELFTEFKKLVVKFYAVVKKLGDRIAPKVGTYLHPISAENPVEPFFFNMGNPIHFAASRIRPNFGKTVLGQKSIFFNSVKSSWLPIS